jgi:hypothetical protein
MIGNFPLWLVIYVWFLQRKNTPAVTPCNYPALLTLLHDMRNMMPVPRTRIQTWLIVRVLAWIDMEETAIIKLRRANVMMTGTVSNN